MFSSSDILSTLQGILTALNKLINAGTAGVTTEFVAIGSSGVAQALYTTSKPVRTLVIQNLSAADDLTLVASASSQGKAGPIVAYQGMVLNRGTASAKGGGISPIFYNVDVSSFTFIIADTGNKVGIVYTQ